MPGRPPWPQVSLPLPAGAEGPARLGPGSVGCGCVRRERQLETLGIAAAFVVAFAFFAVSAAADTLVFRKGAVGTSYLQEPPHRTGAAGSCFYLDRQERFLSAIGADAPVAFARNRSRGRDFQKIAWQAVLQQAFGNHPWRTVYRWSARTATASDRQPAKFSSIEPLTIRGFARGSYSRFRVRQHLYWLTPGHPRYFEGQVIRQVDRYEPSSGQAVVGPDEHYCYWRI